MNVGAQLRWQLTSRLSSRLIEKVMIEHKCDEMLTFCIYVGDDISTPVELNDDSDLTKRTSHMTSEVTSQVMQTALSSKQ